MTIELITFDLDNTLWETHEVIRRAVHETDKWVLEHVPAYSNLSNEQINQIRTEMVRDRPDLVHDISAMRELFMDYCFQRVGIKADRSAVLAKEAFDVFLHWRCQVVPFEGAEVLLSNLSKRYKVASLTNGNANVEKTTLNPYFMFNLNAADAGAMKPKRQIFERALELAGVTDPAQGIHVGDSLPDDIEGAANAGMKTVWVNYAGTEISPVASQTVYALHDIENAVDQIDKAN